MSHSPQPTVSIVTPDQFYTGTSQTAGSQRASAISKDQQIHSSLWGGTFLVEPGAKTGIHHHGEQDTIAYVLAGESLVRWGEHSEHSGIARAGDFLHIPAGLIHQEVNPSATEPFRWIVIRSTPEPIVVNLPDEVWDE